MKKHLFLKSLLIAIGLLITSINTAWASIYDNYDYVYMRGLDGEWSKDAAEWQLTNDDGNHYYGTFYVTSTDDHWFRISIGKSGSWGQTIYPNDGYWFTPSATQCTKQFADNSSSSMKITTDLSAATGYKKLQVDWWGSHSGVSSLKIIQTAVANLSASVSADATSVQGGSTTTVRGGCTGGSGSYSYSYTVTCGGSDVTATVLSGSGENRTFTAPMASTSKTYRVTVTATETNTQLTGLGFTSTNSTYTDITVPGITAPAVSLTVDKINVNQIALTGTINNYNGYGSSASDLTEVGFYIGETKYTASYKNGSTFKKTITGLSANTSYSIKAFATNPLATGYSSTTSATTLANANYTVKVRVAHNATAPKVYAWTDADGYGGAGMSNGTYGSQSAISKLATGTTYDWYYCDLNNCYEKFLIYTTGDANKTDDIAATRTSDCFWYNAGAASQGDRKGKMDCPIFEPNVYIETTAGEEDYDYNEMSTSPTISKTLTLAAKSTYKFKILYNAEYYGKASTTLTRASNSASSLAVDGAYISITTDVAGDYIFTYTPGTKTVSVTYPTRYSVSYTISTLTSGNGTTSGASGSLTAVNIDDGNVNISTLSNYVADGNRVLLTAPAAKSGYEFKGWYKGAANAANWSTNQITSNANCTITVAKDTAVYAVYYEPTYTVGIAVDDEYSDNGGHVEQSSSTVTSVDNVGKDSYAAITAVPANLGWRFKQWDIPIGVTIKSGSTTSATIQINATASSKTVTAKFEPKFGLFGSKKDNSSDGGMPGWSTAADFAVTSYTSASSMSLNCTRTLEPNTEYRFQVKDRQYGTYRSGNADGTMAANSSWTLTGSNNQIYYKTAGYGDYRFEITQINGSNQPSIHIIRPTSYGITIGTLTSFNEGASSTTDGTGGSISAKTTESAVDYTINNGDSIRSGGTAVFTANHADGYTFAGWYTNSTCTTPYTSGAGVTISDNVLTLSSIGANKAVYAKFTENMTTVSISTYGRGTISIDGGAPVEGTDGSTVPFIKVGVHTTHKVTIASESEGYYFAGWELSPASSCEEAGKAANFTISGTASSEDNRTNVTITGLGDPDKCTTLNFLRADFKLLEQIYFRNVFDDGTNPVWSWSNVYVYFDVTWSDGSHCAVTSANNSSKGLHVQMEAIGSTGIYRAYIPRYATKNNKTNVAFADYDVSGNSVVFNPGSGTHHGSYRSDYNTKHNMFVPNHVKETNDGYWTQYYNKGYWMHYTISDNVNAGYWIERRTEKDKYSGKPADQFVVLERAFEPQPRIRYRLRIDGLNKDKYAIFSEGGRKYKANETITFNNCTDIAVVEDNGSDAYFTLTPTAEGEYIITLDQSGDQMKISVEYPIVAGDYVIENAFNDGSAKTTRTNIIKASSAGTKTRYSMYLNNAGSGTLKLRKCNSIDGSGNPEWSDGDDTNLQSILDNVKFTKGVYQFDITIADDKVSEVDSLRLYTGNFYIKTDAASGGWVAYKNNVLTKNTVNFDRADASTFDHYFCKYFASKDCNIKSVIANDYCNQLSDTVKGDGIARMDGTEPYVPIDGTSIRFSYNSATNETKRAYLGASYHNGFLNIVPSTDDKVYRTISATKYDLYDYPTDSAKLKFEDNGNYVYEMDVTVKPGAKAGVRAVYNTSHTQMLIPSTNILLGGTGSSEYSIRIVYDFKTNFMMSAFVLTDTPIEENLADFDMLWVRHKDDSPTQLTLGADKSLSNVLPIGAIEFRYDEMCSSSTSPSQVDLSGWDEYSRPYLKYFISFPFNVHVGSVFGLNDAYYGLDYVIQKYDGATRAADGLFAGDGDNYWINLTQDSIMHANEGYCLILDNDYARWSSPSDMWYNKGAGSSAFIYFPAREEIESIESDTEDGTTVPEHECKVNRWWSGSTTKNHTQTDSHWNLIGQPFFHDAYIKSCTNKIDTIDLGAYYYLDYSDNKWHPQAFDKEHSQIKAMSSFFVQWAGDITWTTNAANDKWKDTEPASAPRRAKAEPGKNYLIKLDVEFNGKVSDWAFVRLADEANDDFVLREDMFKMYNNGIPNIYTFAGAYDVAYNAVPVKSQTIPMGVLIRKNGTYTFSMPNNFSGTVTLIDNFAQTRTNLNIEDYEVYLNKGTINDRFELEINVNNAPTAIDGVTDGSGSLKDGKAHKFIMNDMLYILKDGVLYDARGNRVQ